MTEQFLNEGTHLESFENADGSYGETMYEADGSYAGENHNADATYTTFFGQTGGYTETDYFDANDVKLRDTWVASSERSGNDIYNADGTIAGHIEEHITGDGWRVTEKLTQADEDYASRAITNLSGSLAFADTAYDASTGETAETYHDRDGDVSFLRVGLDGDERDGDGAGRWSYSSENFEDGSQEEEGIDASVASYHSQDSDARHTLTVSASADGTIIAGVVNPERLGFDGAFNEEGDQFGFNVAAPGAGLTHAGYYAGGLTIDLLDSVTGRQVHENGSASGGLYRQVEGVDGSAQDERFYENGVFGTGTFDVLDTYADGSTYSEHHNGTHFGYVDHAANGTSLSESREAQGDWVFNNSYILGEEEFASIAGTPGGSIQADLQIDEIRLHTVYNPTSTNASIWTQHLNAQGWVSDDNLTTAVFGQTDSDEWSSEDGSHGVAAVDALGNGHSETYSVDGSWWIGDWYIDGSFNASWSSGDETAYGSSVFDSSTGDSSTAYHYSDGSYGSSETASDGTLSREYHLANGDYGSVLSEADGHTHREDHWADGSSYSRDTYADGSFSYSTLAGDGDSETESYDAATGQNLRSYTYSDGGYGSLAIDGDGDISAEYHAADGSYATFAKSADGDRHAEYFDAVGDVSMVADIAANVDGSRTLSVTGADGTHEVAEYDADGELQASSWDREDGAHGEYARDGDGQWSGTAYEADGSYHVYSEQADGAWERDFFAADNTQTGNDWRDVDGTFGTHLDYADGGFYDLERDLDGNWTATVGRQDNTQTTTMYAAADGAATVIP